MTVNKIKVMVSQPMAEKTDEEILTERKQIEKALHDNYGEDYEIIDTLIKDHKEKSALQCFSEFILFMSECDVLAMGDGWENARGCKLEHDIAKAYGLDIIYVNMQR